LPLVCAPGQERTIVKVGIRVLEPDETADAVKFARSYAIGNGVADPQPGNPLYELGLRYKTLLLACFDVDSPDPQSESARFFSSVEEIAKAGTIGRDGVHFLYEHYEAWQDACSPQPGKLSEGEFWQTVIRLAENNDPLVSARFRPATLASLLRSMAELLLLSLQSKSDSGSSTDTDTDSSRKSSESGSASGPKRKPKAGKL
jgi:hypothetical protein